MLQRCPELQVMSSRCEERFVCYTPRQILHHPDLNKTFSVKRKTVLQKLSFKLAVWQRRTEKITIKQTESNLKPNESAVDLTA